MPAFFLPFGDAVGVASTSFFFPLAVAVGFLVAVVESLVAFLAFLPELVVPVVSALVMVELEVETDSLFAAQEVKNPIAARTVM